MPCNVVQDHRFRAIPEVFPAGIQQNHAGMSLRALPLPPHIPECAEVVEGHAATFQHGSVESLREKLQELLENDDLVQRYKANAADYIVDKYNWDDVTDQTLNLYGGE